MSLYFELVSTTFNRGSVHLNLKMHLLTFLLVEFHPHDHLILGPMMLLSRFILAFNESLCTSY